MQQIIMHVLECRVVIFDHRHNKIKCQQNWQLRQQIKVIVELVPEDQIGWDYPIHSNPNVPRIVFKDDDEWPEMRDKSGNVIRNYYD